MMGMLWCLQGDGYLQIMSWGNASTVDELGLGLTGDASAEAAHPAAHEALQSAAIQVPAQQRVHKGGGI